MTKRSTKPKPDRELVIARAYRQAIRDAVKMALRLSVTIDKTGTASPRFIQCWAVGRGFSGVTQALDSAGQVWERHTEGKKIDGTYKVEREWWEPVSMERRTRKASA